MSTSVGTVTTLLLLFELKISHFRLKMTEFQDFPPVIVVTNSDAINAVDRANSRIDDCHDIDHTKAVTTDFTQN